MGHTSSEGVVWTEQPLRSSTISLPRMIKGKGCHPFATLTRFLVCLSAHFLPLRDCRQGRDEGGKKGQVACKTRQLGWLPRLPRRRRRVDP